MEVVSFLNTAVHLFDSSSFPSSVLSACTLYMTSSSIDHVGSFCVHENGVAGVKRIGWRCWEQIGERSARGDSTQRMVREEC